MAELMKRIVRHPEHFDCSVYSYDDVEAIMLAAGKWKVSFAKIAADCRIVSRERVKKRICNKCGSEIFTPISAGKAQDICRSCNAKEQKHDREYFRSYPIRTDKRFEN